MAAVQMTHDVAIVVIACRRTSQRIIQVLAVISKKGGHIRMQCKVCIANRASSLRCCTQYAVAWPGGASISTLKSKETARMPGTL